MKREPLFNNRVLRNLVRAERDKGLVLPPGAEATMRHWADQLRRGALDRLTESQAEQTFNNEIFGTVLGYRQAGVAAAPNLMPKASVGRNTADFAMGFFDRLVGPDRWSVVGEIKDSRTDLDQPQIGRANRETPVEQGFRYAGLKPGVEWIVVTNLREIRLYRNGYVSAYHDWNLEDLAEPEALAEFHALMRPGGLLDLGVEPLAGRAFRESNSVGRDMTEGFYGLYKEVQRELIEALRGQPASAGLSATQLYGKTHKLLNRVLFTAFCEDHPAELVPRGTLQRLVARAQAEGRAGAYWRSYKALFKALNEGGGLGGIALNAFNGGLFAPDPYFDAVVLDDTLFERRFRVGRGRRQSLEIIGVFGFQVYDFTEDLDEQALGAIFEQSLKDIVSGPARVRGVGATAVSNQKAGGVYYTPREITSYLTARALKGAFEKLASEAEAEVAAALAADAKGKPRPSERKRATMAMDAYQRRLAAIRVMDPACGSGAFLVEALAQLQAEQEKTNRALAEMRGARLQRSLMDLDRSILQRNLFGRDILAESVEISRLSIWLRTARRGEKLEGLNATITEGDSLRLGDVGTFDAVVGNPPWGADLDGWANEEILSRFPDCGEEKDSYAIFVIRAWELLKEGGTLGFIVPNSWLTADGYAGFRRWLLRHFVVEEVANVWKIFKDVNHDATMVVGRKRGVPLDAVDFADDAPMRVRALARGTAEATKLGQLAKEDWRVRHDASQAFQAAQPNQRFEVIYHPSVADELDRIVARCSRLDAVADVTVGIQAYHHTKCSQEEIAARSFHATTRPGTDWHPYADANDVQRYYVEPSTTQWLKYSERLRDKRPLDHYRMPRILVQQIFWQRLSAEMQIPAETILYMNTLFAVHNARGMELSTILGLINSKFVSAIACSETSSPR